MTDESFELHRLREGLVSRAPITRLLGVHQSTLTRELHRGSWQPEHDHVNLRAHLRERVDTCGPHERLYLGSQAQLQAQARSHQPYCLARGLMEVLDSPKVDEN